jgi:hypothetical protein
MRPGEPPRGRCEAVDIRQRSPSSGLPATDIIARQIGVLPTKGRQVSEKVVGNLRWRGSDNGCSTG